MFAIGAATLAGSAGTAWAQASGCDGLRGQLEERKAIGDRLSAAGKKQVDAKIACTGFSALVQNGNALVKWVETNKDWCQIPDSFVQGIKADHSRAVQIRAKACTVAARQQESEKNGGGGGLLGGNGLSGASSIPRGAL